MRSILGAAIVLALALAGCGAPAADGPTFRLGGAFAPGTTQAHIDDFHRTVAPYSEDALIMESEPPQFSVLGIVGGCEQLRLTLLDKEYVARVGPCELERGGDGGDDADDSTSSA